METAPRPWHPGLRSATLGLRLEITTGGIRLNKKSRTRLLIATGVIVVVFVVGVVVLMQQRGAYYRQVAELTGHYDGKNVKVGGRVLDGTIKHDSSGVRFKIADLTGKAATVNVLYNGQMPSTFNSGVDVVVVGKFAKNDALITADQLQTKCPSKYKGQASPAATQ